MNSASLRDAMGRFPTGVVIVSVRDDLDDIAMTATSLTAVSLEPPLISIGVDHGTHMHEVFSEQDAFGVSILTAQHEALAGRCGVSGRPSARLLFGDTPHHRGQHTQALLVSNAAATLECGVHTRLEVGDHMLVIADVHEVAARETARHPLVRYAHRYARLS